MRILRIWKVRSSCVSVGQGESSAGELGGRMFSWANGMAGLGSKQVLRRALLVRGVVLWQEVWGANGVW